MSTYGQKYYVNGQINSLLSMPLHITNTMLKQ